MIKLIKRKNEDIEYWEVWETDKKTLIIHEGVVGDRGKYDEFKIINKEKPEKVMNDIAQEVLTQGYQYLDEDSLIELVVQYRYESNVMDVLGKRHEVEKLMNECLGWTGNGHCDGGDIGNGSVNIYCYVINVAKATEAILKELSIHNLLEGVTIAHCNDNGDYITTYPLGVEFNLL